ncbi:MAG TPA: hypothetical protein PLA77_08990, partial [Bacteroidales bacterium]|nr:hypothetical protein [Bacteroidales bacterium]
VINQCAKLENYFRLQSFHNRFKQYLTLVVHRSLKFFGHALKMGQAGMSFVIIFGTKMPPKAFAYLIHPAMVVIILSC